MKKYIIYAILMLSVLSACTKEADTRVYDNPTLAQRPVYDFSAKGPGAGDRISPQNVDSKLLSLLSSFNARFEEFAAERAALMANPYEDVPPDETGKIIIVMFHNFVEEYEEGGDKTITMMLSDFRSLLERFYNNGYRTASLSDFIDGSISVQRGAKPVIFTFDDGRSSQFSLIENADGSFSVKPETAVGVMMEFYKEHPDFGLNGTFFVNLSLKGTFGGTGTMSERLKALSDMGLEIGNHTYNHVNLTKSKTKEEIMMEIGRNAKTLEELTGAKMSALALPYGNNVQEDFREYLETGAFEGYEYHNKGVMLVGAEPAAQMYLKDSDPLRIRRVLASGIEQQDWDLNWWLAKMDGEHEYISDGNPDTVTVPKDKLDMVDTDRLEVLGKELVVY